MRRERRTKIAVSIHPDWPESLLLALILAGVNIFRFNCSHAVTEAQYDRLLDLIWVVRRLAASVGRRIEIFVDCGGIKFRLSGDFEEFELEVGDKLLVSHYPLNENSGGLRNVVCQHPEYLRAAIVGNDLHLGDSPPKFKIEANNDGVVRCILVAPEKAKIEKRKGLTLQGVNVGNLKIPLVAHCDRRAMRLAKDGKADYLGDSFGPGYLQYQAFIQAAEEEGAGDIPTVFKYELPEAEKDLPLIARHPKSRAIYLGRGDMGLYERPGKLPRHARVVGQVCREAGIEGWGGTETTLSMTFTGDRPFHGETEGIASLIEKGIGVVVFSNEGMKGRALPVVQAADEIICDIEEDLALV